MDICHDQDCCSTTHYDTPTFQLGTGSIGSDKRDPCFNAWQYHADGGRAIECRRMDLAGCPSFMEERERACMHACFDGRTG
jgi:hypothetical protein